MWLAPGVLSRDEAQFRDAGEFRPERFDAGGEEEKQERHRVDGASPSMVALRSDVLHANC